MNYQSKRQEENLFKHNSWKIDKANDILNQLQRKMYSHFDHKKGQEEQLINSSSENTLHEHQQSIHSTKTKNTFKLYAKPTAHNHQQNNKDQEIINVKSKEQKSKSVKSEAMQLIEEVDAIEMLVRKKLKLKEQKLEQIERQIMLQTQEKVHLFRLNCQLEEELQAISKNQKEEEKEEKYQEQILKSELKRLKKEYQSKERDNKKLKKQEQVLRQTLKQAHNGRRNYIECQLKTSSSKNKIVKGEKQQKYLRGLVIELDKLKKMVKQKMRGSKSKQKLKINRTNH